MKASSIDDIKNAIEGDASVAGAEDGGEEETKRSPAIQGIARGSTPRGQMNQTESRWAAKLDRHESVEWWAYERLRVRYGDGSYHSPDFLVLRSNGKLEVHETKGGHMTDAGRTRFKAAADSLPVCRWLMVMQSGRRQPWRCKYDTASEGGAPFI